METTSGVKRSATSVVITRANGTVEERVVGFTSDDPEEHKRVNDALARGELFTETDLIPHGEMSPLEE